MSDPSYKSFFYDLPNTDPSLWETGFNPITIAVFFDGTANNKYNTAAKINKPKP